MKIRKSAAWKFSSFLVALCLAAPQGIAANAKEPPIAGDFDFKEHLVVEMWEAPREQQSLGFRQITSGSKEGSNYFCKDLKTDGCLSALSDNTQWVRFQVVLPECEDKLDSNCIEALSVYTAGQEPKAASFDRYVAGNRWPAVPGRNIPEGGTTSLWKQPELPNSAGVDSYAVMVKLNLGSSSDGKVSVTGFEAQVFPFKLDTDPNYTQHECFQAPYEAMGNIDNVSCGGIREHCAWSEKGVCGEIVPFAENSRVKLSLRISDSIGGWFSGRIKDPTISVDKFSNQQNLIVVDAAPVVTSLLKAGVSASKASSQIKKVFDNCPEYKAYGRCWTSMDTRSKRSVQIIDAYRSVVSDSATYTRNPWLIRAETVPVKNSCLAEKSRVLGIVATNSMVYQSGIPTFESGSLNYWVAGMHYLPDKQTPVLGTYDLVMRSDVARCLYGFSNAPVEAAVTITGQGDSNVATKVVGESNGWLKLAAYGFTFSTKTIGFKLSGQKAKKTTLTCVTSKAPKKTKKVSGANPICPSGYVKK